MRQTARHTPQKPQDIHCDTCGSRGHGVFCDLLTDEITALDQAKVTNCYRPRQVIFYEGNQPFGIYCLNAGKVKIYKSDVNGHQDIVRIAGPGDILGYRCLLAHEPYTATAETIEESQICFIDKKTFQRVLIGNPSMASKIMAQLAQDVRRAEEKLSNVVHRPVRERLAELFLVLATKYGDHTKRGEQLAINLTRAEWAEMVGTTQETVIRLISDFRREQLIAVEGRAITLLNKRGLTTAANLCD